MKLAKQNKTHILFHVSATQTTHTTHNQQQHASRNYKNRFSLAQRNVYKNVLLHIALKQTCNYITTSSIYISTTEKSEHHNITLQNHPYILQHTTISRNSSYSSIHNSPVRPCLHVTASYHVGLLICSSSISFETFFVLFYFSKYLTLLFHTFPTFNL